MKCICCKRNSPKRYIPMKRRCICTTLREREPIPFSVTVPSSYNSGGLVKKGVKVYYVKPEWYGMGICETQTPGGHVVKAYDMERTICDILRKRADMDIAVLNYAIREYMKRKDKRISV